MKKSAFFVIIYLESRCFMSKKSKVLIGIVLLVLAAYFGYKCLSLIYYHRFDYDYNVVDDLEIEDTIRLNYHKELEDGEEYLNFENIKIRNDFKDFVYLDEISSDKDKKYAIYDENGEVKASFWIGIIDSYVSMLKGEIEVYAYNRRGISLDGIEEFLDSKGISNDIHLLKYLEEHQDDKNNIFTSVKEMKGRYVLNNLIEMMFPVMDDITLINGTYAGYMFDLKVGGKQVCILDDDKCFVFTFIGEDYLSDEYIYELLDTIVIESVRENKNIFTRTYKVIEKIENNSLVYDSFRVKQYQGEEAIVDIKKELAKDIEIGKNYEFTFDRNNSEIDDNIKSIFENAELISVIETDKVGLEQVQDKIK